MVMPVTSGAGFIYEFLDTATALAANWLCGKGLLIVEAHAVSAVIWYYKPHPFV